MRLATVYLDDGVTRAAVDDADGWAVLEAAAVDDAVRAGDLEEQIALARRSPRRLPHAQARFARPLRAPGKIVCCGLNYRDHIAETGRETPTHPTLFGKFADTLTDPFADIVVDGSDAVDWEAELAVVVGTPVVRADVETAQRAILGYTVANDVSIRDWQSRTLQWMQGKTWDATTPLGPFVVTADAFDPAAGARIEALIDDEVVQSSTVDQLLFGAADLLAYISRFTRLSPGDVVLTGTPSGVGLGRTPRRYLRDGETLTTRIDGIGELRNTFRLTAPVGATR